MEMCKSITWTESDKANGKEMPDIKEPKELV
jgi:hypothetical protein